ncbi:MAG: methyltransferase domain-containing protein [Candidatus Latescibacterota bacterium]
MRFYCFTVPGLEGVAAAEIGRCLPGARLAERLPGVVFFAHEGDPSPLLRLSTVEDVFALVARGPVSGQRRGLQEAEALVESAADLEAALAVLRRLRPRKVRQVTFRVVVQRRGGGHQYIRPELGRRIAAGLGRRFRRWRQVDEGAVVEVWVLQHGEEVVCGLRLSDRHMRHRAYKQASIEASLRPTVARSMVVLSDPQDDDLFLDPFCGAATILIERGEHGRYAGLLGGDLDPRAVAAARANIGPRYRPIAVWQGDAGRLPLAPQSVTRVVTNLPFGHRVGSPSALPELYRGFLAESLRVLRPGGRLVLLTSEKPLLQEVLAEVGGTTLERILPLQLLGRRAFLSVARVD